MKTKFIALFFCLMMTGTFAVFGQEQEPRPPKFNLEEFKQKRIEFLKKEIGLTPEEAKAFIPLCDELMLKKFELNKVLMDKNRNLMDKSSVSDAEYEDVIMESFDTRRKELRLEREYYEKFKTILSPEKIYKYQQAEMKLARNMVNNRERPDRPDKDADNQRRTDRPNRK